MRFIMDTSKLEIITQILNENKIKSIEILDLSSKSPIIEKIIVGTFPNEKNSKKIARQIKEELEKEFHQEIFMEGEFPGEWIIFDLGKYMLELFVEEKRTYYNLEKLWGDNKNRLAKIKLKKRKRA